jgi:hypothetical protein
MSKKSRRRNKKILAALALAGGAALMGRGRGEISSNRPSGIDAASAAKNWITKKGSNVADTTGSYLGKMTGGNPNDPTGHVGQKIRAAHAAAAMAPKNIFPPGSVSMQRTGLGPRRFKKGGRVTGAAKRGFGRALMKGKK